NRKYLSDISNQKYPSVISIPIQKIIKKKPISLTFARQTPSSPTTPIPIKKKASTPNIPSQHQITKHPSVITKPKYLSGISNQKYPPVISIPIQKINKKEPTSPPALQKLVIDEDMELDEDNYQKPILLQSKSAYNAYLSQHQLTRQQ